MNILCIGSSLLQGHRSGQKCRPCLPWGLAWKVTNSHTVTSKQPQFNHWMSFLLSKFTSLCIS